MAEKLPIRTFSAAVGTEGAGSGHHSPPPRWEDPGTPDTSLTEYLGLIRRHLALVAFATLIGGGVATYYAYTAEPQYMAGAVLRLADARQAIAGRLGDAAIQNALSSGADPLLSQLQVLRSRGVGEAVVEATGLRLRSIDDGFSSAWLSNVHVPDEASSDTLRLEFQERAYVLRTPRGEVRSQYGQTTESGGIRLQVRERPQVSAARLVIVPLGRAVESVLLNLSARPRDRTDIVDLQYTAHDPLVAQAVANAFAHTFQQENERVAQRQSRRRRMFVQEQLRTTDSVLAEAQRALTEFRSSRQMYSSRDMLAAQQQGLIGLQVRHAELASERHMYARFLSQLEQSDASHRSERLRTLVSAPGISSNLVFAQLFGQLLEYRTALDSLTAGEWAAAPTHPDVRRVEGLIAVTESRMVNAVRSHVAALDARLSVFERLEARHSDQLATLPRSEAEEMRLLQDVETASRMAVALREELQRARIAEAVEGGQVEIVDLARVPTQPIGSGKGRKIIFGVLVGLLFGSGGAFLRDRLNTSIRHKDDLEHALKLPSLGTIPQVGSPALRERWLPWTNGNGHAAESTAVRLLIALPHQRTSAAEAYRTIRTNLLFSNAVQRIRTLVVTSATPSDGKTTTAANLAITFAQQGIRVLLVDCDFRRPRVHKVFNIPQEPGLTGLVLGDGQPESVAHESQVENLWVLPTGRLPPNPAEFLGGDRMRLVLDELAAKYEVIIIDTPPLLAASDAAVLGSRSEAVLLVVRAGKTQRTAAQQAVQQLQNVGARVIGAVLNDPAGFSPRYGEAYYQYEYYGD